MKIIITIFCLFTLFASAQQPWIQNLPEANRNNYYKIQQSFKDYVQSIPVKSIDEKQNRINEAQGKHYKNEEFAEYKIPGFFQYKRWEWLYKTRLDANGDLPSKNMLKSLVIDKMYQRQQSATAKNLLPLWKSLNPATVPIDGGAGRVNAVRIHPSNSNLVYACAAGGGLWKSTTGGGNWIPLGDNFASTGSSDVALSDKDQNLIFVGTGDGRASDNFSVGLLKSVNAGATFDTTGLEFNISDNFTIKQVIIHSKNNKIIYALSGSGFYRSEDGGVKFKYISSAGNPRDMVVNPYNPNTLFLTTTGGIKKSVNAGKIWTNVSSFPYNNLTMGRLAICNTLADSNYMYVMAGNATDQGGNAIYKTINYGVTWTKVFDQNVTKNLMGWDVNGNDFGQGQSFYSFEIGVSSTDKNKVFVGGVNVWRSTNGGTAFSCVAHWYGAAGKPYVHADIHSFEFLPTNGNVMYVACDGGVFKTTNGGASFTDLSNGLNIQQFYKIGCSQSDSTLISTGSQDNGSAVYDGSDWRRTLGGDGMETMIQTDNSDIIYSSLYYADINRSDNRGFTSTNVSPPVPGNWVTPFMQDPNNPNTIYVGTDKIYKSTDQGNSYTSISNSVTGSSLYDFIAIAPSNSNYIYTIRNGALRRTTNGGVTWSSVLLTGTFPLLTSIAISDVDPNLIWVTYGSYSTTPSHVFKSTNGGASFTDISYNLSFNIPVNTIVHQPNSNNTLFIGTDFGVLMFKDGYTGWVPFDNGLPSVKITELEIQAQSNNLRAGTYGRGLWEAKLPQVNLKPNDAAITSINSNARIICNNLVSSTITIYNNGADTLKSLAIQYGLSGQLFNTFNWIGILKTGKTATISLPSFTAAIAGDFQLKAFCQSPNGFVDINTFNDSVKTLVTIEGVALSTPFIEGFEGTIFPPTGWTINNPDNFKSWEQKTTTGQSSAKSAVLNNANYTQGYKQQDELISPVIQVNANDSLTLSYDYAYTYWTTPRKFTDTLAIFISKDCGATYQLKYKAWGDSLATVLPLQVPFVPTSNTQWKSRKIYLGPISGATLLVKFVNISDWENNLYIDNISVQANSSTSSIKQNSLLKSNFVSIMPNPNNGIFSLNTLSQENTYYELFNVSGQLILKDKVTEPSQTVNITGGVKGLYILKVYAQNTLIGVQKIIIE